MKQIIFLAVVALAASAPVCSFSQDKKATVYFIRETGMPGFALGFNAFIDSAVVCRLNNNRYSVHEVSAGVHSFHAQTMGKKEAKYPERIVLDLEEGKTYYIQMVYVDKYFVDKLYVQEITSGTAQVKLKKCKEDTKCLAEKKE
ncbi:hypothetical protein [Lacibacter sp.]|jgi:hypothetical protein|uniref:hypothetical protein n=1 Tax=Lacibacter sp. TaxID=1915409 RepID=UPI002B4B89AA|nr:hypothetical protein [Lacibacter sp.]HLP35973.1 hypothetical protein [Lacibacter sp.]